MIDKFKKVHYFLKELWLGFSNIAQLEEAEPSGAKKAEASLKLLQLGIKKILQVKNMKDIDDQPQPLRTQNYNEQINKNKVAIKLNVLEYVEKIILIYLKVHFFNSLY